MKNSFFKEEYSSKIIPVTFAVLSVLSLLFVVNKGALISADSRAYFGMWPYVSAGYPFFLRGLHFLFGDNYPVAVVVVQFIAVLSSIYLFVNYFLQHFKLKLYQLLLLLLLLFYPIFDDNISAIHSVSTEGLSYALFLQIAHVCFLVFVKRKFRYYWVLLLLTVILITIRGQFIFLTPLYFLVEGLIQYKEKQLKASKILLILLIPFSTFIIDNTYHRIVQKQFFSTPLTWTVLVSSVLFVSEESDEQYLTTEEEKEVFKLIHQNFRTKGIGYKDHKYHKEPIDYNYYFFHYEFPTICNQTVQREAVAYFIDKNVPPIQAYLETERVHKQLFLKLFPANFSKWIALIFQSFLTGIGGVFIVLIYAVVLFLLLKYYLVSGNNILLFFAFLLLINISSRILISITVHSLTRYFFYTDWISVLLVFLGINELVRRSAFNKEIN